MSWARGLGVAVVVGSILGVATQLGQSVLPEGLGQLANSISPWLTVAFFVGALQARPRIAAAAGFVTLALALVGYYALVYVRFGYTGGSSALLFWTAGALGGGLVYGPAGWYWRHAESQARIVAVALLGSAWLAEAAYVVLVLSLGGVAIGYALVGLAVPLLLCRTARDRLLAFAAMVPAVLLGGLGFAAAMMLNQLLAGG